MTPAEHYAKAESILAEVVGKAPDINYQNAAINVARAQVHATLALANPKDTK